jgi:L-ascorbate metabolism protein UlaG (beta-lactamase superfamily)
MLAACLAACAWPGPGAPREERMPASQASPGLTARWFGVTTLVLDDGKHAIMIDGFFSRPPLDEVVFTRLQPKPDLIRQALERAQVGKVDAIFVSHSHYDHALDAPWVAREKQALLLGSESTLNIARAAGVAKRCPIAGGQRVRIGAFEVEVFETPHSSTLIHGVIGDRFAVPAHALSYRMGQNFSFLVRHPSGHVLIVPSAASQPGMLKDAKADIVFLGIAQLGLRGADTIDAYWKEAVTKTEAKLVIPVHWDNFMLPATEALRPFPAPLDKVDSALEALHQRADCKHVGIRLMPFATPVPLPRHAHPSPAGDDTMACPPSG